MSCRVVVRPVCEISDDVRLQSCRIESVRASFPAVFISGVHTYRTVRSLSGIYVVDSYLLQEDSQLGEENQSRADDSGAPSRGNKSSFHTADCMLTSWVPSHLLNKRFPNLQFFLLGKPWNCSSIPV